MTKHFADTVTRPHLLRQRQQCKNTNDASNSRYLTFNINPRPASVAAIIVFVSYCTWNNTSCSSWFRLRSSSSHCAHGDLRFFIKWQREKNYAKSTTISFIYECTFRYGLMIMTIQQNQWVMGSGVQVVWSHHRFRCAYIYILMAMPVDKGSFPLWQQHCHTPPFANPHSWFSVRNDFYYNSGNHTPDEHERFLQAHEIDAIVANFSWKLCSFHYTKLVDSSKLKQCFDAAQKTAINSVIVRNMTKNRQFDARKLP